MIMLNRNLLRTSLGCGLAYSLIRMKTTKESKYGVDQDGKLVMQDQVDKVQKQTKTWYSLQRQFWDKQPTTIEGVLQGHANTSDIELAQSKEFLRSIFPTRGGRALDAGCGIGRVSKHLLLDFFSDVDLLD